MSRFVDRVAGLGTQAPAPEQVYADKARRAQEAGS